MGISTLKVIQRKFSDDHSSLITSIFWLIASEGFSRGSRIITLVVLGLYLTPVEYGTLILALATHDLLKAFSRTGVGSAIIQAQPKDLPSVIANARRLQWLTYLVIATAQITLSDVIGRFYDNPQLSAVLCWMALSYLIYPLASITVFNLQRAERFREFSLCSGIAIAADNLSCALLVLTGFGIESIAYSKFIGAVVWVAGFTWVARGVVKPSLPSDFSMNSMLNLLKFSGSILCSELLKIIRVQGDLFIAGRVLPAEAFGLYGFARNMGLGLAQSLSSALITVWHPWLSKRQRTHTGHANYISAVKLSLMVSMLGGIIFVAQAVAANWYVPLLFNGRWDHAIPLVSLFCFCAVPHLVLDAQAITLRVFGFHYREMLFSALCTAFPLIFIAINASALLPDMASTVLWASYLSLFNLLFIWLLLGGQSKTLFYRSATRGV